MSVHTALPTSQAPIACLFLRSVYKEPGANSTVGSGLGTLCKPCGEFIKKTWLHPTIILPHALCSQTNRLARYE